MYQTADKSCGNEIKKALSSQKLSVLTSRHMTPKHCFNGNATSGRRFEVDMTFFKVVCVLGSI